MNIEAAVSLSAAWIARTPALLAFGGLQPRSAVRLWFGSLTIVFHRTSVNLRWLPPSFVLAQREMEKRRSPLVHSFRPFGAGIF
jgi:hypothetical protein